MFSRMCGVSGWWGADGEVVEILEGIGVRRAKVMAAGELVEVAALGAGEIHLGDRVALACPRRMGAWRLRESLERSDLFDCADDDSYPEW